LNIPFKDEGNLMSSQGWQKQSIQFWNRVSTRFCLAGLFLFGAFGFFNAANANTTIRDVVLKGNNEVEVQFDSPVQKGMFEIDFVRDIVQVSVQKATIYPAKILHAKDQSFNKVFGYQYSPNLVRIRFSVEGSANQYQGKLVTQLQGSRLLVRFPKTETTAAASEEALLAKVMAEPKAEVPAEKVTAEKNTERTTEKSAEKKPLTGKKSNLKLTSATPTQSVGKSFLAMFLVVGALGLTLIIVKRKRKGAQATKVGDSWIQNLLPQGMRKQKSLIEVVGQHALGPKQSITVVRIRGQQFVLGVTQDSVQLITQLDADETEVDLLDDPKVAASIGKMFGNAPVKQAETQKKSANFDQLLKGSTGATAVMGRAQYAQQFGNKTEPTVVSAPSAPSVAAVRSVATAPSVSAPSIRDQIRRRLEQRGNA
jgi:flagellar biogenesis protein FliO